jgi:hypothetical protein
MRQVREISVMNEMFCFHDLIWRTFIWKWRHKYVFRCYEHDATVREAVKTLGLQIYVNYCIFTRLKTSEAAIDEMWIHFWPLLYRKVGLFRWFVNLQICFISRYFTQYWLQWQTDNFTIWQTWWFWLCNRQLSSFYVVTYHFRLLMVCTSPSWFDMQEHVFMFCVWGFFKTKQTTLKSWCCKVIMNLV